jgi:fatty acid-binding protein DegV
MKEERTNKQRWAVMAQRHEDDDRLSDYRPTVTHDDQGSAEAEAMRLAILNAGHTFDVIRVTQSGTALTVHVQHHS